MRYKLITSREGITFENENLFNFSIYYSMNFANNFNFILSNHNYIAYKLKFTNKYIPKAKYKR